MYIHGGDIYTNSIALDFSINVNPNGTPFDVLEELKSSLINLDKYPEYKGLSLKTKLSEVLKLKPENIVLTSGASEGFMAICHALAFKKAAIFDPCFYGYEYALNAISCEIERFALSDLILDRISVEDIDAEVLFLANPNNPTGQCFVINQLEAILKKAKGKYVVIDECFLPLTLREKESLIYRLSDYENAIIVRSFTKTFAIPGIRLGYIVAKKDLAMLFEKQLPEWNLSSMAITAGMRSLDYIDSLDKTRKDIFFEANRMMVALDSFGFEVMATDANFIMFFADEDLYDKLIKHGILIRDCSNFYGLRKGFYRIAIRTKEENSKLIEALEKIYE